MSAGPLEHVSVVLVRPRQPGNVGTAARAIANHGLGGLVLVDPPGFDPERARWMAPGAGHVIDGARFVSSVEEAVAGAWLVVGTTGRNRRWSWPIIGPGELADRALGAPGPVALLFGPEDTGLTNQDMASAAMALCLPTAEHASLNLGQAVTVLASTLLMAREAARPRPEGEARAGWASVGQRGAAVDEAMALLGATDHMAGRSPEKVRGTLFRLLGRADPSDSELGALRGMVKSLDYSLRHR